MSGSQGLQNALASSNGYTTQLGPASYVPLTIQSVLCGGPIRSVTVGNYSAYTTVSVYLSSNAAGSPAVQVLPGNFITFPTRASSAVTLTFAASGGAFDGSVFVHADTSALSASGFTQAVPPVVGASTNTFPAASQMITTMVEFTGLAAGVGNQLIGGITGKSIHIYSYTLTAFNTVANSNAFLNLFNSAGILYGWLFAGTSSGGYGQLAIAASGGPLPLFAAASGYPIGYQLGAAFGGGNSPIIDFCLNVTYAMF